MAHLWDFFKRGRPSPTEKDDPQPPEPTPAVEPPSPPPVEPPPPMATLDVGTLDLTPRVQESLVQALSGDAHALLYDPEEFSCVVCSLGNGQVTPIGECSLDGYQTSREALLALDGRLLILGDRVVSCRIYHAVTDLGHRTILQFFPTDWDEELQSERRKSNVRLLNRLRPGTSLSRHNRETLLGALHRAGSRPEPSFLERLDREGLVPAMGDDLTDQERLERVIRREVLPRKTVARLLAEHLGLAFIDVEEHLPRRDIACLFTRKQVLDWEAIPCAEEGDGIAVAIADPTDEETKGAIEAHLGRPVTRKVAAATDIRVATDKTFKSD